MKFVAATLVFSTLALATPSPVKRVVGPAIHLPADESALVERSIVASDNLNSLERRAEVTTCYNIGTTINRDLAVQGIAAFCAYQIGKTYSQNTEFYVCGATALLNIILFIFIHLSPPATCLPGQRRHSALRRCAQWLLVHG
jgi:hypothetical protein